GPDRAGIDPVAGIVGIPLDAGGRLRAGRADPACAASQAFARSPVLPDSERRYWTAAAAPVARRRASRCARPPAGRRPLYLRRRSLIHRYLCISERRGAPVQSVLLRSGEPAR